MTLVYERDLDTVERTMHTKDEVCKSSFRKLRTQTRRLR